MALLLGTAAIGIGMIGFGNGRVGRRFSVLDSVYGAVLAIALWMIIDLDYPSIGIIRVSNLLSWKPWLQGIECHGMIQAKKVRTCPRSG